MSLPTSKIKIIFTTLDRRYRPRGPVIDTEIETTEPTPVVRAHVAEQHIIGELRKKYPEWAELSFSDPISIFVFGSYQTLWNFSKLKKPKAVIASLRQNSSAGSPGFWGQEMNVAVLVKGDEDFDWNSDQDPVINTYPAALSRVSRGQTFVIDDLRVNNIVSVKALGQVEKDFQALISKKPSVTQESFNDLLASNLGEDTNKEFQYDPSLQVEWDEKRVRHVINAANEPRREEIYKMRAKKELTIGAVYLYHYQSNIPSEAEVETMSPTQNWPDGKYLHVLSGGIYTTYNPRNDMGAWTPLYPLWAGEICSNRGSYKDGESDYYRMLFQAAGLVSFFNLVEFGFEKMNGPGFIFPLAYIDRDFEARIYILREENERFRYTQIKTYDLATARGSAQFLKFMYHILDQPAIDFSEEKTAQAWSNMMGLSKAYPSMSMVVGTTSEQYFAYPGSPSKRGYTQAPPVRRLLQDIDAAAWPSGVISSSSRRSERSAGTQDGMDEGGTMVAGRHFGVMVSNPRSGEYDVLQVPARQEYPARFPERYLTSIDQPAGQASNVASSSRQTENRKCQRQD